MRKAVKKVFLSYARADERAAREISASLQGAGYEVWDPGREILPGSDFAASLQEALNTSDAMVVLLSPDSAGSTYQQHEIGFALGAERFSGRLIPVVVRETKDYPWIFEKFPMIREHSSRAAGRAVAEMLGQPAYVPEASRTR
jgi:TIR domain